MSRAMFVMMADNASSGLLSLCGETATAALPLSDHLRAFLAGGDAVAVAFKKLLASPANDGSGVAAAFKFARKLALKIIDV